MRIFHSFIQVMLLILLGSMGGTYMYVHSVSGFDDLATIQATRAANMRKYAMELETVRNTIDNTYHISFFRTLPTTMYQYIDQVVTTKSNKDFTALLQEDLQKNTLLPETTGETQKISPDVRSYVYSKLAAQGCSSLITSTSGALESSSEKGWEKLFQRLTNEDAKMVAIINPAKKIYQDSYQETLGMFTKLMSQCKSMYDENKKMADMIVYAHFGHVFANQNEFDAPFDIIRDISLLDRLFYSASTRADQVPLWAGPSTEFGSAIMVDLGPSLTSLYKKTSKNVSDFFGLSQKELGTVQTVDELFQKEKATFTLAQGDAALPTCLADTSLLVQDKGAGTLNTKESEAVVNRFTRTSLEQKLPTKKDQNFLNFTKAEEKKRDDFFTKLGGGQLFSDCWNWNTNQAKTTYGDENAHQAEGGLCVRVDLIASTKNLIGWARIDDLNDLGRTALLDVLARYRDLSKSMKERDLRIQRVPRQNFQLSDLDLSLDFSTSLTVDLVEPFPLTAEEKDPEHRKKYSEEFFTWMMGPGGTLSADGQSYKKTLGLTDSNILDTQVKKDALAELKKRRDDLKKNQKLLTFVEGWKRYGERVEKRYNELISELTTFSAKAKSYEEVATLFNSISCYK